MPDKALTDITIAEALDLLLATRQSRDNAVAAQSSMNDQIVALHRQIDQMQQAKLEAINIAPAPEPDPAAPGAGDPAPAQLQREHAHLKY